MASDIQLTKLAECAGCGAKVGAGVLAQLLEGLPTRTDPKLLVGYDTSDDASVYQLSDDLALVQTVDFFPPIVDDPYLFGQIAAANAISDVYAMGGEPKLALNVMCVSPQMDREAVHGVLRGGYEKAYEAGTIITGGHTIQDKEPKYGLAVSGFVHPGRILRNDRARPGDVLILTKALGIGVTTTAAKAGLADPDLYRQAVEQMRTLNKTATATSPSPPPGWRGRCPWPSRTSSTTPRPPADFSSRWRRRTPRSSSPPCGTASPAPPRWAMWRPSGRTAPSW